MNRVSKLVLAAVVAASLPAAAAARDCDHGDDHRPVAWAPPAAYPPPPPPPARYGWREARWRERQLAALRDEFRALDDERARFYAMPGMRRGQVRRFERSYAERRAELERRWHALQLVAMW
jgi:hypothetical protein